MVSRNLDAMDVIQSKLASAAAIISLLISDFEGTSENGDFTLRPGIIADAHGALDDLVRAARAAAGEINFQTPADNAAKAA